MSDLCEYTRWQIIDQDDNKDYKCDMTGKLCYGELRCKYYKPEKESDHEHDN